MLNHYKSLISDEEVIKALIKDSKKFEGTWESTRLKPNLQFFERTVNNMVSNNKRISHYQDKFKAKYQKTSEEIQTINKLETHQPPQRQNSSLNFQKINFVKATDRNVINATTPKPNLPQSKPDNDFFLETRLIPQLENKEYICIELDEDSTTENITEIIVISSDSDDDKIVIEKNKRNKNKKKKEGTKKYMNKSGSSV